jgi:hypothetical protein
MIEQSAYVYSEEWPSSPSLAERSTSGPFDPYVTTAVSTSTP